MKYFKNTSWLFSYAMSFVGLFAAIATLGLNGILVRELVKDESRRETQYSCENTGTMDQTITQCLKQGIIT